VGERISVTLVVQNVGTLAVEFPLQATERSGVGYVAFVPPGSMVNKPREPFLRRSPSEQKEKVIFELNPAIEFTGGRIVGVGEKRAIRIEPGGTLRIPVPIPLAAKEKGTFHIAGELWLQPFTTYKPSQPTVPYAPMEEILHYTPVPVEVK